MPEALLWLGAGLFDVICILFIIWMNSLYDEDGHPRNDSRG